MRTSRASSEKTRAKIIDAAGKLFIRNGFSSVGILEVMKAAGLTHGGFYGRFKSKEELAVEASRKLFADYAGRWRRIIESHAQDPFAAILEEFFDSEAGCDPDARCILTSLSQETGQRPSAVQGAFSDGVRELIDVLQVVVPGVEGQNSRGIAFAILSTIIGAATLARAIDDVELAKDLLSMTRIALPTKARGPSQTRSVQRPNEIGD